MARILGVCAALVVGAGFALLLAFWLPLAGAQALPPGVEFFCDFEKSATD
jgi:hypothetical protein